MNNLQQILDFFIELTLIFLLILTPIMYGAVGKFAIMFVELGAFLILFLWFFKLVHNGHVEIAQLPIGKTIIPFLLFILIQYIFINSFVYDFTLGAVYREKIKNEALKLISYLIVFYAIINNFQTRKKVQRLSLYLIITGFLLSVLGITQKLAGAQAPFWLHETKPSGFFFASFPNKNHFANYINMIVFLTMGILFVQLPILRKNIQGFDKEGIISGITATFKKGIWLYIFAVIIMASALIYTISRGAIIAFLCSFIIFSVLVLLKRLTKRGYIVLFTILTFISLVILWIGAPGELQQRFRKIDPSKKFTFEEILSDRKTYVDKAVFLLKDYPLCGVGFGALEFVYNKRYRPLIPYGGDSYYYIDHLHNDFVELLCEVGWVGFTLFFISAILYTFIIFKNLWKRKDPIVVGATIGIISALFSMCVHSVFEFNFHITSNAILFFTIAALGIVISHSQVRDNKETNLLPTVKLFSIKNMSIRWFVMLALTTAFIYSSKNIITPYIAYKISEDKKAGVAELTKAVRLDPLNDKYHFLLARSYIEEVKTKMDKRADYVDLALKETKEAIRLNPWNEYYPVYLDWILKTFIS